MQIYYESAILGCWISAATPIDTQKCVCALARVCACVCPCAWDYKNAAAFVGNWNPFTSAEMHLTPRCRMHSRHLFGSIWMTLLFFPSPGLYHLFLHIDECIYFFKIQVAAQPFMPTLIKVFTQVTLHLLAFILQYSSSLPLLYDLCLQNLPCIFIFLEFFPFQDEHHRHYYYY